MQYKTVRPRTLEDDDMETARAWAINWAEGIVDDEHEHSKVHLEKVLVVKMEQVEVADDGLDVARPAGA